MLYIRELLEILRLLCEIVQFWFQALLTPRDSSSPTLYISYIVVNSPRTSVRIPSGITKIATIRSVMAKLIKK